MLVQGTDSSGGMSCESAAVQVHECLGCRVHRWARAARKYSDRDRTNVIRLGRLLKQVHYWMGVY